MTTITPVYTENPTDPDWGPIGWAAEQISEACIDTGGNDSCDTIAEQHPESMQHITDFAGGALDMNPIYRLVEAGIELVSDCDIDLASQGVDRSSGWYTAGQVSMVVVDVGSGTAWATGARFRFAVHDAHHTFGSLGKLPHLQWTFWRAGVKGSDRYIRIPFPKSWFK